MPYDLFVWEGDQPADDQEAGQVYHRLCEQHFEESAEAGDALEPPRPSIVAYVHALVERYPEPKVDVDNDSPWAVGPLLTQGAGPIIEIVILWVRREEVSVLAAQLARDHGLVCYDPQLDKMRP